MRTPIVRRGSDPSWMRPITDRLSPIIRGLVIANALLFAFYVLVREARGFIDSHLALGPGTLGGEFWQPVTALFVHLDNPWSFFFDMLGLWFVGATIERQLGTRRFLLLFFLTGVGANVLMALLYTRTAVFPLSWGCATPVTALFVVFGTMFDRMPSRVLGSLVLEARVLAALVVGFALFADISRGQWVSLAGTVFASLVAYVMAGGRGEGLRRMLGGMRAKRVRRRYQVLEGGRGARPRPEDLN